MTEKFRPSFEDHEPSPEATDIQLAMFLAYHIDNPCGVEIAENERVTIRDFYIREAERQLKKMTDEIAIDFLQNKIREYKER